MLRDLLLAYEECARGEATEAYRDSMIVWANIAPYSKKTLAPPKRPKILKE